MRKKRIELQWQGGNEAIEEKRVTEGEKEDEAEKREVWKRGVIAISPSRFYISTACCSHTTIRPQIPMVPISC
ncbi:hypothetical protein TSUD_185290 [Trifolium subterraneum]|uniref:Uncharacterized protein n=1 Tax=Trifolium subterraneum TaxID=3900 RepID=A0A2Z6PEV1_TRISU|nr:hypothetical protein TSUD_185290 [Trifolium subterraneum]